MLERVEKVRPLQPRQMQSFVPSAFILTPARALSSLSAPRCVIPKRRRGSGSRAWMSSRTAAS